MSRPRYRFKKVYVEITSACNLACSFCPPTFRPAAFLSVDRFRRTVRQIQDLTSHIYLHVKGEPLLHPRLPDLLDVVHAAGLGAHIVTNGTLITNTADSLLGHPALRQISFSLHSFLGVAAAGRRYLEPILVFAAKASEKGQTVALRFWREADAGLLAEVERNFGWQAPEDRKGRGFRVAPSTFVHFESEFSWPSLEAPLRSLTGFCLGLRDQIAILVDGSVVPCCLDGEGVMTLGNVYTEDLTEILRSSRALALYQGFTEQRCVEPLCQRCEFRQR